MPVWKSLKQGHEYCHSVFGIQCLWCMEQSRHVWQKCTWANHFLVFTGKAAVPWGAHIWSKEEFLLYKYHQNHRTKSTNDDICIFSGQLASSPASPLLLMRTPPPPPPPPTPKVYTKFKQRPSVIFQSFTFFTQTCRAGPHFLTCFLWCFHLGLSLFKHCFELLSIWKDRKIQNIKSMSYL